MSVPPLLLDLAAGRVPTPAPADWDAVGDAATRHGMSGLVAGWASRVGVDVPHAIRHAALLDRYLFQRAAAVLPGAVAAFALAGAPVLAWKGVTLASRHYAVAAERPCGDVDLLARTQDAAAVAKVLDALAPAEARQVRSPRLSHAQEPNPAAFESRPSGPAVDVQFSLLRLGLVPRDEARVWARAVGVPLGDTVVAAPDDPHLLVALLVHLARSSFARLVWYADVARVATRAGLDVDEVARFARTEGVAQLAASVAHVVGSTLGVTIPALAPVPRWYRIAFNAAFPAASRLSGSVREGSVRFVPRLAPATLATFALTQRRLAKAGLLLARARNVRGRGR